MVGQCFRNIGIMRRAIILLSMMLLFPSSVQGAEQGGTQRPFTAESFVIEEEPSAERKDERFFPLKFAKPFRNQFDDADTFLSGDWQVFNGYDAETNF